MEASLQQMRTPCQGQPPGTEGLAQPMELPPQLEEQRAKVYEHLAVTSRELGESSQQLAASQQKFLSLPEMIKSLQASTHHLQSQVEELKSFGQGRRSQGKRGPKGGAPGGGGGGFPGGKELAELYQPCAYEHVFAEKMASLPSPPSLYTDENKHLKKLVRTLRARLSLEQQRRGALEEQFGLLLKENEELEQQLGAATGYWARTLELEAAVAEIRRVLQLERPFVVEKLVPGSLLVPFREPCQSLPEEMPLPVPEAPRRPLQRPLQRSSSCSDTVLSSLAGGDIGKSHQEGTCIPKAKAVKPRDVSWLQELDTQYGVLKAKYEELLKKCEQQMGDSPSHKAVPTARAPAARAPAARASASRAPAAKAPAARAPPPAGASTTGTPPPKYKVLFKEIFSCIQKRKQVDKQGGKYRSLPSP